jgi:hypothetical protein
MSEERRLLVCKKNIPLTIPWLAGSAEIEDLHKVALLNLEIYRHDCIRSCCPNIKVVEEKMAELCYGAQQLSLWQIGMLVNI